MAGDEKGRGTRVVASEAKARTRLRGRCLDGCYVNRRQTDEPKGKKASSSERGVGTGARDFAFPAEREGETEKHGRNDRRECKLTTTLIMELRRNDGCYGHEANCEAAWRRVARDVRTKTRYASLAERPRVLIIESGRPPALAEMA